jgi:phage host-nuclease inhibitor protein Gam
LPTVVEDLHQVASRANELLAELGRVVRDLKRKNADHDDAIQKVNDEHGPEIDRLTAKREELKGQIADLVLPRFWVLAKKRTKTIFLRNGEISLSFGRESVEVAEGVSEETIIGRIRRRRGLKNFTRVGKRTLNRDALRTAPWFVAKINDLAIVRKPSLTFKPAEAQGEEIKHDVNPLSVPAELED